MTARAVRGRFPQSRRLKEADELGQTRGIGFVIKPSRVGYGRRVVVGFGGVV